MEKFKKQQITREELRKVHEKARNRKIPGPDNINMEDNMTWETI